MPSIPVIDRVNLKAHMALKKLTPLAWHLFERKLQLETIAWEVGRDWFWSKELGHAELDTATNEQQYIDAAWRARG
jgi:hypothetical protein